MDAVVKAEVRTDKDANGQKKRKSMNELMLESGKNLASQSAHLVANTHAPNLPRTISTPADAAWSRRRQRSSARLPASTSRRLEGSRDSSRRNTMKLPTTKRVDESSNSSSRRSSMRLPIRLPDESSDSSRRSSMESADRQSDRDFWGAGLTPRSSMKQDVAIVRARRILAQEAKLDNVVASHANSLPSSAHSTEQKDDFSTQIPRVSHVHSAPNIVWSPGREKSSLPFPDLTDSAPTQKNLRIESVSPSIPRQRSSSRSLHADSPDPAGAPSTPEPAQDAALSIGRVREVASRAQVILPRDYSSKATAKSDDTSTRPRTNSASRVSLSKTDDTSRVHHDVKKDTEKRKRSSRSQRRGSQKSRESALSELAVSTRAQTKGFDAASFEDPFPEASSDLWDSFGDIFGSSELNSTVVNQSTSALRFPSAPNRSAEKDSALKKAPKQKRKQRKKQKRESTRAALEAYYHFTPSPEELEVRGAFDEEKDSSPKRTTSEAVVTPLPLVDDTPPADRAEDARVAFEVCFISCIFVSGTERDDRKDSEGKFMKANQTRLIEGDMNRVGVA